MKKTIEQIRNKYYKIAKLIDASEEYLNFSDTPTHTGAPHIEYEGTDLCYVITERGSEFERRRTKDPDKILQWLIKDLVFSISVKWELNNRDETNDCRRKIFQKELELMGKINPLWKIELEKEIKTILTSHPYDDYANIRAKRCEELRGAGTSDQEAWTLACKEYPESK